jgi:glycosyltransferase involved in cell wall biosynthesis
LSLDTDNRALRLLFVVPEYEPVSTGGGPVHYEALKRCYESLGHSARIVSGSPVSRVDRPRDGVEYLPLIPSAWTASLHSRVPNLGSYMPPRPLSAARLARALRGSYDVYHLFGYGFPLVDLAARYLSLRRKRFAFTVMGAPYSPSEMGGALLWGYRAYEALSGRGTLRRAHRIHAISRFAADNPSFARYRGKIDVIYNGTWPSVVPPKEPQRRPSRRFVLSIGRLQWSKGFQTAIEAVAALAGRGVDAQYVLVGPDAGYRSALEETARSRGVADRVTFAGAVAEGEKEWYLAHADLVVIPSLFEPFGLVSLEAMIRGKIAIASATGGLEETIEPGVTGFLFPPGDASALADVLARTLSTDCSAVAARAKMRAERQTWPHVAGEYIAWYRKSGLIA